MTDTQHAENETASAGPQDTVLAIRRSTATSYHIRRDCCALKSKTAPEEMSRHRAVDILDRDPCPHCTEVAEVDHSTGPRPQTRWSHLIEAEDPDPGPDTEHEVAGQ